MTTELAFIRLGKFGLDLFTVVQVTHTDTLTTPEAVMTAFENGVTEWVETTDEGRKLWEYSCEDLNIGDLCGEDTNETLAALLDKHGISKWEIAYQLTDANRFDYDRVLAHPKE